MNDVISHDLLQNMMFSHPERSPAARARGGGHGDVYAACAQNATAHAGGSALRLGCGYAEEAVGTGDAASLESSGRFGCKGKGMDLIWLVVLKIFYFHPYLGKISNLTN